MEPNRYNHSEPKWTWESWQQKDNSTLLSAQELEAPDQ